MDTSCYFDVSLTKALQKRLSPTDHSRKVEFFMSYNALKTYIKNLSVEYFLYDWERIYGIAIALNLPDVSGERALYYFALAIL